MQLCHLTLECAGHHPLAQALEAMHLGLHQTPAVVANSVFLYGIADSDGVMSLAAAVDGDDGPLTKVFATLNEKYQLILVDWRLQMLLVSTTSAGQVNVWRP